MMTTNTLLLRLAVVVPVCVLMVAGPALAQDSGQRGPRISDWQRERTPATSAFPDYPEDARRDRLEGEARVCFTVDSRGEVVRPKIRSSTHRVFERPTLKAIRASTFKPLEAGQIESPLETCRTYRFRLDPLDPLYVSNESTAPEAALPGSDASFAVSSSSADPAAQIEQASIALARTDAPESTERFTLVTEASPLPPVVPVCETRKRPGTRIDYKFCYTPEQQAANQEIAERSHRDMQQEGRWVDQTIIEAQMQNGYPRGAGLGPR